MVGLELIVAVVGLVAGTVCVINVSVSPDPPMVARPVGYFLFVNLKIVWGITSWSNAIHHSWLFYCDFLDYTRNLCFRDRRSSVL